MNLEERVFKIKNKLAELYTRLGYNADGSSKKTKIDDRPASNEDKKYNLQAKLKTLYKKQ